MNAKKKETPTEEFLNSKESKGNKPIYLSKTFWVNVIALVAMLAQMQTGFVISPEEQIAIIAVINILLRIVTGQPIEMEMNKK